MTLYTNSTLEVNPDGLLKVPLNMDMATYLNGCDLPVPGAHLEYLGVRHAPS